MIQKLRDDFATDAGMLCIWNPSAFGMIDDYDSWEKELLEDSDIRRHIKSGNLVPVNIGSDGCWGVEVRVGTSGAPEALTDRESKYVVVSSEPYLLVSNGSLCISGLEHVHGQPGDSVGVFKVPKGQYAVTVQLIGWDDEPGMKDKKGNPKKCTARFCHSCEFHTRRKRQVPNKSRDVPASAGIGTPNKAVNPSGGSGGF